MFPDVVGEMNVVVIVELAIMPPELEYKPFVGRHGPDVLVRVWLCWINAE